MSPQQDHPPGHDALVEPGTQAPIWDRFFTIAPPVLIGTREVDGGDDVAHATHEIPNVEETLERAALPALLLLSVTVESAVDVLVAETGASPLEPYNGSVAMEPLKDRIAMLALCASDHCAVLGVQQAFGRKPDLLCGPAANTDSAVELVGRLCGVHALSLLRRRARPELVKLPNDRLTLADQA